MTLFTQNGNINERKSSIKARIAVSYFPPTTNKLRTILKEHQIQLIPKSDRKLKSQLPSNKDKTADYKKSGIYQISCGTKNLQSKIHWTNSGDTRFVESSIAFHMLITKIGRNQNHTLTLNIINLKLLDERRLIIQKRHYTS
jgi:hypothetical protein